MFKIFHPFSKSKNKEVFITTWNIASIEDMIKVVKEIDKAKKVYLIVGYSKETHDLEVLKKKCFKYKELGWSVKVIPGFHAKIWVIGNDVYVGSCNFCKNTIHNYMHQTYLTPRLKKYIAMAWKKGYNLTSSSKLSLLPQVKIA